jgi:hypothetical protein
MANTYRVKRSLISGGPYALIASGLTSASYTDATLSPGTTYYYVVSAVGSVLESPDSAELATTFSALQAWRLAAFGTSSNSGNASDTYDFDGDGVPNLLEYALGTSPTQAASMSTPVSGASGNRLTLTFLRAVNGVTYIAEASPDLASWTTIATNPGSVGQNVTVSDTVDLPAGNPPQRFLRLRVTSP